MTYAHPSPALSEWNHPSASPMLDASSHAEKPLFSTAKQAFIPINTQSSGPEHAFTVSRVQRIQHYFNIFTQLTPLFSVGLTVVMDGIMVYCLYRYYTTRNNPAPEANRVSPWAKDTQLWPTFVLLIGSSTTLIVDGAGLIAMCCRKSRRATQVENKVTRIGYVVWRVKWIFVFVLYRIGKTSNDLWGWSCDEEPIEFSSTTASRISRGHVRSRMSPGISPLLKRV